MRPRALGLALLVAAGAGISAQKPVTDPYRAVAEQYVRLVLAVGPPGLYFTSP